MYLCILLEHFVHQQLSFWDFFEPFLSMKGWFNVKLCKVPFAIQLKKREYDLIWWTAAGCTFRKKKWKKRKYLDFNKITNEIPFLVCMEQSEKKPYTICCILCDYIFIHGCQAKHMYFLVYMYVPASYFFFATNSLLFRHTQKGNDHNIQSSTTLLLL